jgi:Spy/CpxP family protein refolding chaperone
MNYVTTSKVVAYLAIIFVAGGATGAVITYKNARSQQAQPASMEKACTRFQDRLVSRLALTPDQVARLQPVFDQTSQKLRAIHSKALRNTDEVIRRAHEQIARELTPEQKAKLECMEKERQEWLEHRLKDHPADEQ